MGSVDAFLAARAAEARRERLAALLPGGSPERPRTVTSAASIEAHATGAMACPLCAGEYRVVAHERPVPHLRRLDVRCRQCGTARALWFTIVPALDAVN